MISKKILKNLTKEFMLSDNFTPLTLKQMMMKLHIKSGDKDIFRKVLGELTATNIAKFSRGRYHPAVKKKPKVISGKIKMHPRGFGFVTPDNLKAFEDDIFIPKHLTQNSVDGDLVEVEIKQKAKDNKGPEGKVITILERAKTHLSGIVKWIEKHGDTIAYVPVLGQERKVVIMPQGRFPLHIGDRLSLEVVEWGEKNTETICRAETLIGNIAQASHDIQAAIIEFELPEKFSKDAITEAKSFKIEEMDLKDRVDLTDQECFTIDPDTAKDFDDALSLTIDKKGHYHLSVHIADVSYFVTSGSHLDETAFNRCNSVYFPGFCLPMLPSDLSENLCSLKPNVKRLTVSTLMHFDKKGKLVDYKIVRSQIMSQKRFTYKEAKKVIDGHEKSPHAETLKNMVKLTKLLKSRRYDRGSVEFAIPEVRIIVDEKGNPLKTEYISYDITHQMVEEFMLQANELVAKHLSEKGKDLTYRIHEEPSKENLSEFAELAKSFGFKLPHNPEIKDIQYLFDDALQTPFGHFLSIAYIRSQKLALYSPQNIGHFGLSFTHYCHFTSPIRRYVDLVIHRILFGDEMEYEHLVKIADLCSKKERLAMQAENSVILLKTLRMLNNIFKKNPHHQFEAAVTRVRNFGIYFEVIDFMFEGFLPLSQLEDDFYRFDKKKNLLKGVYTGKKYRAGDRIIVMLKELDLILQETKWYFVSNTTKSS